MSESSRDVAKRIIKAAQMDIVERIAPQVQAIMTSEPMTEETAAFLISSLVGWYVTTIDRDTLEQFEQLIEVQIQMAVEVAP